MDPERILTGSKRRFANCVRTPNKTSPRRAFLSSRTYNIHVDWTMANFRSYNRMINMT